VVQQRLMIKSPQILLVSTCTLASIAALVAILFYQVVNESTLPSTTTIPTTREKAPDPVVFQDISLNWEVVPTHQQTSEHLSALTETLGGGICAIDVNKDGWMDLFFIGGSGHTRHYGKKSWWHKVQGNRFLLNKQGRYFEDVSEQAGLQESIWGMACAVADFDNDGFQDLIITGVGTNQLLKNNGNTTFTDITDESGIINNRWSTGASLADFNGDGLIDIYISNYILFKKGARTFERTSGFRTTNTSFDQTLYDPEPNRLYLNKGNFQFEEVAEKMGVANSLGRSLGAKWVDINKDSWPDLLVINDHNTPNQLFINHQGQSFSRGGDTYAPFEIAGAHDVVISDFDNNSKDEFFMSRGMGHPPVILSYDDNQQNYTDAAWTRGVAQARLLPFSGWASTAADFNNDGFLDLYVANGNTLPDIDSHFVSQAQRNSLFINNGDDGFLSQAPTSDPQHPYSSRGVISVDLDNDGQLEVIVSNNNGPLQIFKNSGAGNNWLVLDLNASFNDAEIYGARLSIKTDTLTINRTLLPPQHFLSQSDLRIHIGLGESSKVNELLINWRDGRRSVFRDIPARQYYVIDRESNTLRAQTYQVAADAHFNQSLSEYSNEALTSLAQLVLRSSFHEQNRDDLLTIWRHSSTVVRNEILKLLAEQWDNNPTTSSLSIIKQALYDQDSGVQLNAIQLLKHAELEASVVWLIPLLNDDDINVQCAVTETFRFFFDEEEAVTHRKMLAISPLIKLLERGSPEASLCAANALAAAENKRAILPLMHQAKRHRDIAGRAAAIRALGLIRDTQAMALLRQLVQDTSSEAPIVASGLIALSRLRDPALNEIFDQVFKSDAQNPVHLSDTLNYLFSSPDGIVFSKTKLVTTLQQVITRAQPVDDGSQTEQRNTIATLRAISAARAPSLEPTALSFVNSADPTMSVEALIAIASPKTAASRTRFESQLLQRTPAIIETVLVRLGNDYHDYSSDFVTTLFNRPNTSSLALKLLQTLPNQKASRLLETLLREELSDKKKQSLLDVCTKAALRPRFVERSFWSHPVPDIRLQAIDCYLEYGAYSGSSTSTQRDIVERNVMTQMMLKTLLANPNWDNDTKNRLLIKAASNNPVIAKTMLSKRIDTLPEKWLPTALQALDSAGVTPSIEEYLWTLYRNKQRSSELRLQAAIMLMDLAVVEDKINSNEKQERKSAQIMDYLYQTFVKQ